MQARELEGGVYKCFNDRLDFVVDFSVARELKEVFDEELKTVWIARYEETMFQLRERLDNEIKHV